MWLVEALRQGPCWLYHVLCLGWSLATRHAGELGMFGSQGSYWVANVRCAAAREKLHSICALINFRMARSRTSAHSIGMYWACASCHHNGKSRGHGNVVEGASRKECFRPKAILLDRAEFCHKHNMAWLNEASLQRCNTGRSSVLHEALQWDWKPLVTAAISGRHKLSHQVSLCLNRNFCVQDHDQSVRPHLTKKWQHAKKQLLSSAGWRQALKYQEKQVSWPGTQNGTTFAKCGPRMSTGRMSPGGVTHRQILCKHSSRSRILQRPMTLND